jgi:2'-5' RNA ligase
MASHRLFFALRPDAAVLDAIGRAAAEIKAAQNIRGRWLDAAKLHLTVQFLGDFASTDEIAGRAALAAAKLRFPPFEFVLDRAETFARRFSPPCVLRCAAASTEPLLMFARELGSALAAAGLSEFLQTREYVPHVTIAYAKSQLHEAVAIAPIGWCAQDFCLIDSVGGTHHEIGRWPLRSA